MSEAVKPSRPYQGAARQARTRRTRAAVTAAARSLFAERGYAATTIEAISERSDTPQATVYRLFSSKLGILKALLDVSIAGDDEAVAMLDRPPVRALLSSEDPKDQLAGLAALVREVMTRVGPVHRILADAARSDPDAASLLAEIARQRHEGQRRIASSLARSGALRPGLAERDAADVIHALASPEVHGLLVYDRGWTSDRHEEWLRQILIDQLLPRELPDDRLRSAGSPRAGDCSRFRSGWDVGKGHPVTRRARAAAPHRAPRRPRRRGPGPVRGRERRGHMSGTGWGILLGIIYLVLLFTLAVLSFRKGHWVLGLIGFIFPILWIIGAMLPSRYERL